MSIAEPVVRLRRDRGGELEPCPIAPIAEMVFSRWTTAVLWLLHREGPLRFGDLKDRLGGVTAKVLTQRLRQLERDGLIARTEYAEAPPRVEYTITDLGLSLEPAFQLLGAWGDEHLATVHAHRAAYDRSGRPRPA